LFAGVVGAQDIQLFLHEQHVRARWVHGDAMYAMAIPRPGRKFVGGLQPAVHGFHVLPPSSVRSAPAAEMAT